MKNSPFNSLQDALTKAQKAKQEAGIRKTGYFLVVGLDFGTAFTKCMVREIGHRVIPVSFSLAGEETFLLPSELIYAAGKLGHPLDAKLIDGETLSYLKMALTFAAKGRRSDWLDSVMNPLGIEGQKEQYVAARALVIFYLVRVLQAVRQRIGIKWKDFGQHKDDTIFYNMAVPVADSRDTAVHDAFRESLETAVALLETGATLPSALADLVALTAIPKKPKAHCELLPEVTANVQSYVRSRAGREGLYLFADVGAGTVDFSVFIFFKSSSDTALTFPHAAVELLGSSQLEMRTFRRAQNQLTRQLRLLKEGATRKGDWKMDLPSELKITRDALAAELTEATEKALSLTKKKLTRWQFSTMQILFGGGGCAEDPYQNGVRKGFHPRWGLEAESQKLPLPGDVDWPDGQGPDLFRRFSVAYGLSFSAADQPMQKYPDEVKEFAPEERQPRAAQRQAVSKDEV